MSEKNAKAARKAARERGESTGSTITTNYLVPQWPNRAERRRRARETARLERRARKAA
jgi:hypothetical protein